MIEIDWDKIREKRDYELYLRIGKILAADAFIYSLMVVDNVLRSI